MRDADVAAAKDLVLRWRGAPGVQPQLGDDLEIARLVQRHGAGSVSDALAEIAVRGLPSDVYNPYGFLGAAVTQGPLGAVLDSGWAGLMAGGARVYPLAAYRRAFGACALFVLTASVITLLLRETQGRNIYCELKRPISFSASGRGSA